MAAKMKMFTMGRADFAAYEYLLKQTEAVNWIEEVLNEKLSNPDLKTSLSDGVILCKVAAKMYPDDMKKWNGPGSYRYKMIENIELFLAVAEKQGVTKNDLFEPPHLFDKKNMPRVLYTLQKFAASAEAKGFSIKWKVTENPPDFTSKEIQEAKMLENVAPDKRNLWGGDKKSDKPADDKEAKEREEERKREMEKEKEREAKEKQREAEEKAQLEIVAKLQAEQEAKRKKEEEERKKREKEEEEKKKKEEAENEAKRKAEAEAIESARQKKQKELEAQLIQKQKEAEEVELKRKQKRLEEEELEVEKKFDGKKKLTQVRDDLANLEKSVAKNEFDNSTLHEASTRQMDDVVRYMLQIKKADPNVTNANNDIPLHLAVQYPSQKIVEYLIEAGSNVNNLNRDADTPLHKACSANASIDVVRKLLDKGADLNSRNMNLETPLLLTVSSNSSDPKEKANQTSVVTELIKRGVDVNVFSKNEDTALHLAAQRGDVDLVNVLSKAKGADLNARNKRFATPLQVAIENERLEVAKRLIELGADIHVQRNDGWSPLYTASYNGDVQSATLLLSKGADVNVKNDEGWSPLHATCSQGHLELTKVLVRDYKAKVNVLNDQGTSPVFHSVCAGKRQITAYLVEEGSADVDLSKDNGWKPIHAACYNEFEKLTNYLVDHGASLSSPCKEINNYTPLHILISTEEPPMTLVKLLIKKGAKLNVQNSTGGTPLHLAAFWGHDEVAKYLVDATADLNVKNDKGRTALDVSALYGHKKIAELLAAKMKKPVPEMQKRQIKTKEMVLPTDAPAPSKS